MSRCPEMKRLEDWSRQGARAALPAELAEHAGSCSRCRQFIDEIQEVREQSATLPTVEVPETRLDAIRFALMASARRSGAVESKPRPKLWAVRRVLLAAATLTVLVIGLRALIGVRGGVSEPPSEPASLAEVRFAPGAVGSRVSSGRDEVVAVQHGSAEFSVRSLSAGERFRVVTGKDTVEVRGTRFRVVAKDERLMRVDVAEGWVLITIDGKLTADLRAGQHWTRPTEDRAAREARAERQNPAEVGEAHEPGAGSLAPSRPGLGEQAAPTKLVANRHSSARATMANSDDAAEGERRSPDASMGRHDAAFQRAWKLLQAGKAREAAAAFDALARERDLDPARRADVLYWSAKAHQRSGDSSGARARADELLKQDPEAWHAPDAALLMGESLVEQGKQAEARRWLNRAATTGSPAVQRRAHQLLSQISK